MFRNKPARLRGLKIVCRILSLTCLLNAGCSQYLLVNNVRDAIPASRLPPQFVGESRTNKVPIDFTLLRQDPPVSHIIGPGDVLGIYINGVIPPKMDELPMVLPLYQVPNIFYAPTGIPRAPNLGLPIEVDMHGSLELPLVGGVTVSGMTLPEARREIARAYIDKGVVQEGRERVLTSLIKARVHRVMVLRLDTMAPQLLNKAQVPYSKRGQGQLLDLPAFENDVLHALTATDGLPGLDAFNEVWIFRARNSNGAELDQLKTKLEEGIDPGEAAKALKSQSSATRIPLRITPGEPLCFTKQDVILQAGDIVYVRDREIDMFYTGGQLPGGRVPLPRDHDVDILEAIELANVSAGGPSATVATFRTGVGAIIPPTRVLIIRKLPNGQTVRIRVDLLKAMHDPKERIIVQSQDQVMLFFKPNEFLVNVFFSYTGLNGSMSYTTIRQQ